LAKQTSTPASISVRIKLSAPFIFYPWLVVGAWRLVKAGHLQPSASH
jgi:hypothetical protein